VLHNTLYRHACRPASEANRQAVVGQVVDKTGRRGGAVLVAPRLVILAEDTLYGGEECKEKVVFWVKGQSAVIIQAWSVGDCILAEL
jgi:hypothetical protein